MPDYKSNEYEFQGMVVGWLNEFLAAESYPFDTATQNPSLKTGESKTQFPDIQLWINYQAKLGFCGWELKTPKTKADDSTLLEDAAEKAHAMKAEYFVTWNMRDTIIWTTPNIGERVKAEHRRKQYPALYQINSADDLKNEVHKISLKNRAKEILDDLTVLKNKGTLQSITADDTFFVKKLRAAVDSLYPDAEKSLKKKAAFDIGFRKDLAGWASKQGTVLQAGDEFYRMVARQMVYRLLARIIFYETLTGKFKKLPELNLNGLSGQKAVEKLKELFSKAADIDWLAVFQTDLADTIELSEDSIDVIHKLIDDLNYYNFALLPHDVIGAVFEKLIPEEERHTLGQYFTRENLVDLILAFCLRTPDATVIDPTCGTGTFLIRAYDKKKTGGLYDHKQLLSHLWGVDIAHFPAELATINLFRQDISDPTNFPRILCQDFFDIQVGQTHKFPPLKASLDPNFQLIDEKMPLFDAAVGNFPFKRQELISKQVPNYKEKLEKVIKEEWLAEYPDAFDFPENDKKYIQDAVKAGKKVIKNNAEFKLSGQADIYAYLFFHTARFVKEGGRMGFITSNSWLDVAYGYELQKFMLNNFKLVAILESRCEPWFEDAAVNTIVTILEKCSNKAERDNNIVKFVKIKKKLTDLIPYDMKLEALKRWQHLENLVDFIDNTGHEHIETSKGVVENSLNGLETKEAANFRIRIKRQGELLDELNIESKTVKWGKYLRAPEIYYEIVEQCSDKLINFNTMANIKRGITTGINEFFYLTEDRIRHWGIEDEFLIPVFKSPKESTSIAIAHDKLKLKG
ncbi:MAG: N-6 DNA methylase, partial [Dehalococcoidia bacterium]|nr:N-6 DNA methylase [Dehalococcoidia bacterium]